MLIPYFVCLAPSEWIDYSIDAVSPWLTFMLRKTAVVTSANSLLVQEREGRIIVTRQYKQHYAIGHDNVKSCQIRC